MSRWSLCVLCVLVVGLAAGCRTGPLVPGDSLLPVAGSDSDELGAPPAGDVLAEEGEAAPAPGPAAPPAAEPMPAPAAPAPPGTAPCPPPPPPPSLDAGAGRVADAPPVPGTRPAPPGVEPEYGPGIICVPVPCTAPRETCDPCAQPTCMDASGRRWRGNYDWMTASSNSGMWPNAYLGLSGSFLPNLGAALTIGGVYKRTESIKWCWEVQATWQPFDDELIADDGNPKAGDWWQAKAGVKIASAPLTRRHLTGRWGGVWCFAGDEPNIVDKEGNYFGAYAGIGYEADLTPCFTTGPELSALLMVHEDGDFVVVPQFNWHFIWNF